MKPSAVLLLLFFAAPAFGQSTPASKPAVHRAATAAVAAKPAPECGPELAAGIPKAEGACKPMYTLRYIELSEGTGPVAETRKWITVHYTGYLPDGTKFDSSLDRGEPITFPYGAHQVITGWDTGFEGMKVGGKRRLLIPYQLAYGETGRPPTIPAKALLVFDVELLGVSDVPPSQKPAIGEKPPQKPGETAAPQPTTAPADPAKPATPSAPPAPAGAAKP